MDNGFRGRGRRYGSAISDINVTPFVDVLLVLLVIFMLTAHVMETGIDVDVPKVVTTRDSTKDLPIVTVTKDGLTFLGDEATNINLLAEGVRKKHNGQMVYLRADKDVRWEVLAQVMAALGEAKIPLSAVTRFDDTGRKKGR
jgi:biopolymer transport protein ExbD